MDHSKKAAGIFNKYASEYQNKFMDVGLYKESLDLFCASIKKQNAGILELACGPGNITNYLLNKRGDLKIFGIDLAPNMIELAKQNNPSAEFKVMDCREIVSLNKTYDAIMCGFCLPYLSMPETQKLIADCSFLLNTGGILYLSTMEDAHSASGFRKGSQGDEIFMHYYLESDLVPLLEKNNFTLINTERVRSEMTDGTKVVDLIIIAERN
jgi:ubiquinone/menaquinone biosynthesis C-methylase UbiE